MSDISNTDAAEVVDLSPSGNSYIIKQFPRSVSEALGLKSEDGRPMICGGSSRSCYIYDVETDEWLQGPEMHHSTFAGDVVELADGTPV